MKRILPFLLLASAFAYADPSPTPAQSSWAAAERSSWAVADSTKALRRILIRGKFDSDIIKIQNGALWIVHKAHEMPSDITINSARWKPEWPGKSSSRYQFALPLEGFENGTVQVKKIKGRSELASVQLPSAQNKQTLAIKIVDEAPGVDMYEILIRW